MEVIVKYKGSLDNYNILICFCYLLGDGFSQIMCIASFNFNLNRVEGESIISEQFSVLRALQVSLLTRCAKMWDFVAFSKCSLGLLKYGLKHPIHPFQVNKMFDFVHRHTMAKDLRDKK